MTVRLALDAIQALLLAAGHPGLREIEPYGPGVGGNEGVKARFTWGAEDSLWAYFMGTDLNPDGRPIDRKPEPRAFPDDCPWITIPDPKADGGARRKWLPADYMLRLVHDLCDTLRPAPLTGWTPVGLQGVGDGHGPSGLAVTTTDGQRFVLRVMIGSGSNRDPDDDPWPDYRIPDGLTLAA